MLQLFLVAVALIFLIKLLPETQIAYCMDNGSDGGSAPASPGGLLWTALSTLTGVLRQGFNAWGDQTGFITTISNALVNVNNPVRGERPELSTAALVAGTIGATALFTGLIGSSYFITQRMIGTQAEQNTSAVQAAVEQASLQRDALIAQNRLIAEQSRLAAEQARLAAERTADQIRFSAEQASLQRDALIAQNRSITDRMADSIVEQSRVINDQAMLLNDQAMLLTDQGRQAASMGLRTNTLPQEPNMPAPGLPDEVSEVCTSPYVESVFTLNFVLGIAGICIIIAVGVLAFKQNRSRFAVIVTLFVSQFFLIFGSFAFLLRMVNIIKESPAYISAFGSGPQIALFRSNGMLKYQESDLPLPDTIINLVDLSSILIWCLTITSTLFILLCMASFYGYFLKKIDRWDLVFAAYCLLVNLLLFILCSVSLMYSIDLQHTILCLNSINFKG
jgi:hypothetical protein